MSKSALLLINLQVDFAPGGALPVADADELMPVANRLMERFDLVVAVQESHPIHHISFASSHPEKKPGDVMEINGVRQTLWPVHCVGGSPGAELLPGLRTDLLDKIVRCGTETNLNSYSAFFEAGHKKPTELGEYLTERDVTDVYVLGLCTEHTVRNTVSDGLKMGFRMYLITDGCRGVEWKPGDQDHAFEEMKEAGATLVQSSEMLPKK